MVKSNYIIINSKYRTKDSKSTSEFTYSLGESLEIKGLSVKSVTIPNVAVNVNKKYTTLHVEVLGLQYFAHIPSGQYNTINLMSAVQASLSAVTGQVYTLSQNTFTQRITVAGVVPIKIFEGGLAKRLGYTSTTLTTTSNTAQSLPSLSGVQNYYLGCVELVQGFNALMKNGERLPILGDISANVPYGSYIHYESQDFRLNMKTYQRVQNIQWLTIKVYDEDSQVVDLQGLDIEMVIKIYEEGAKELL